jgi:hypothetical protein
MNLPGFTAIASLYKMSERYYTCGADVASTSKVVPAIPNTAGCANLCAKAEECDLHGDTSSKCKMAKYICNECGTPPFPGSSWGSGQVDCIKSCRWANPATQFACLDGCFDVDRNRIAGLF